MTRSVTSSASSFQRHEELVIDIDSMIFNHVCPPSGLGTRQSGLTQKMHAVIHSIRLECTSWPVTSRLLQCFVGICADMGTEMELNQVTDFSVSNHFNYWTDLQLFDDDGNCDDTVLDAPDVDMDSDGEHLSFQRALYVPGSYHLIDNLSKGLLQSLGNWTVIKEDLAKLISFFHGQHNRELFMRNLLPEALYFKFSSGPPSFDGGRTWGIVHRVTAWLLERKAVAGAGIGPSRVLPRPTPPLRSHEVPLEFGGVASVLLLI